MNRRFVRESVIHICKPGSSQLTDIVTFCGRTVEGEGWEEVTEEAAHGKGIYTCAACSCGNLTAAARNGFEAARKAGRL